MTNFAAKHVVISGGSSGIGAAIAAQFASSNAQVSILGRDKGRLEKIASETGALPVVCDVTVAGEVESALSIARDNHGPVAIAVANAGIATSKPFASMSAGDINSMMDVNLLGVFNLWHASFTDMKQQKWGRMLAIASTAGLKGYPYVSGYCAAKHAVVGLTRSLAQELARTGITVNAVCPGFVDTPMLTNSIDNIVEKSGMSADAAASRLKSHNPMGRFITAGEVASATLWLASNSSSSINGQAVSVNGGEL